MSNRLQFFYSTGDQKAVFDRLFYFQDWALYARPMWSKTKFRPLMTAWLEERELKRGRDYQWGVMQRRNRETDNYEHCVYVDFTDQRIAAEFKITFM